MVDDDDQVRDSLSLLLSSLGYACRIFPSGKALLAELLDLEPGCILLDFRMGGLTGLQVLSELRFMEMTWPVIVMTGHGDMSVGVKSLALGAIDFLEKPFDQEVLVDALERGFKSLSAKGPLVG